MEYEILETKIINEKVVLKYILNNTEKEIEIMLKTYTEFPFYSGKKIDEKEFKKMLKLNEKNKVYDDALKLLKRSDLTKKELEKKLQSKYSSKNKIILEVIKELESKNLINDDHFIKHYIKKSINSFKGVERIKYELSIKGIDEDSIYEYIDDDLIELEKEKAYQLGSKQMRFSKNLEFRKMRDKVYYKLSYAGYNKELIDEIMFKLNLIKEI